MKNMEESINFYCKTLGMQLESRRAIPENNAEIGFEIDERLNRLLLLSATDNLMKGAAGNGVQCMNLMNQFDETAGLLFPGLHPV